VTPIRESPGGWEPKGPKYPQAQQAGDRAWPRRKPARLAPQAGAKSIYTTKGMESRTAGAEKHQKRAATFPRGGDKASDAPAALEKTSSASRRGGGRKQSRAETPETGQQMEPQNYAHGRAAYTSAERPKKKARALKKAHARSGNRGPGGGGQNAQAGGGPPVHRLKSGLPR